MATKATAKVKKATSKVKKATSKHPIATAKPVSTSGKRKPESKKVEKNELKAVAPTIAVEDEDAGEVEREERVMVVKVVKRVIGKEKAVSKKIHDVSTTPTATKKSETSKKSEAKKSEKENKSEKANSLSREKKKKAPVPSPSESENDEDEEGGASDEEDKLDEDEVSADEEEVLLHGFSSESDSSDEDDDDGVDKAPIDVGKLPTVAKDDASVKRKLEWAKKQASENRGVIYLGRIPHGFYEDQMRAYFAQFGDVTRLRLSRNKKTGTSKHYGFIEFSSSAVAEIVAETMDNYLLMGHILRCKIIPKDEVHPSLWVGANRKFRRVPVNRVERLKQNKPRTEEEQVKVERRLLKRQEEKKRKLQASGIDYDFGKAGYKKSKQDV